MLYIYYMHIFVNQKTTTFTFAHQTKRIDTQMQLQEEKWSIKTVR